MKKRLLGIFLAIPLVYLVGCTQQGVRGNGHIITQSRTVSPYTTINVGSAYRVVTTVGGNKSSLTITADANLEPYIVTQIEENTLQITTERRYALNPSKPILITINTPKLIAVHVSGASQMTVTGITSANFDVTVSGTSHAQFTGKTDDLQLHVSGASDVLAKTLPAKSIEAHISGASKVTVNVSQSLTAHVSGASTLTYTGNPKNVNNRASGASRIDHVE
ncbi:MAG: hypothetical protein COB66_01715 [Coxiella sp. (in: Bacteria)]|nr:MAG: hypothetical protein COB66_01715 [Coxiella sp. (in: g-proteobacteria)]